MNQRVGMASIVVFLVILFLTQNLLFAFIAFLISVLFTRGGSRIDPRTVRNTIVSINADILGHLLRSEGLTSNTAINHAKSIFIEAYGDDLSTDEIHNAAERIEYAALNGINLNQAVSQMRLTFSNINSGLSREQNFHYIAAMLHIIANRCDHRLSSQIFNELTQIGFSMGIPLQICQLILMRFNPEGNEAFQQFFNNFQQGSGYRSYNSGYSDYQSHYHQTHQAELQKAYEILGCDDNVTKAELRKIKRNLMAQYHPDKARPSKEKEFNEKFQEINWASEFVEKHKGF